MTIDETQIMLKAKAKCIERICKGIYEDCNEQKCDNCDLCYAQGTNGEQIELMLQCAEWLEELKVLKENSISKEAFEKMKSKAHNHGYRQGYAKAIDEFAEEAIKIVYDSNDRDRNPQPRDMVADIHYKLMDLAKLLKEQNK